jgi:hypothetical protein
MAGRPRTMIKRVDGIEIAAFDVANAVSKLIPEKYRENAPEGDPVAEEWKRLLDTAVSTWGAASDLNLALRDKAGLPEDCPTDRCHLEYRSSMVVPGARGETSESRDQTPESDCPD